VENLPRRQHLPFPPLAVSDQWRLLSSTHYEARRVFNIIQTFPACWLAYSGQAANTNGASGI